MRQPVRIAIIFAVAFALSGAKPATASPSPARPYDVPRPHAPILSQELHGKLPAVRGAHRKPANNSYTIDDLGSPPAATYIFTAPVAFDNAGRVAGYGFTNSYALKCVLNVSGHWLAAKSGASVTSCNAMSISDLSGSSYELVGFVGTEYSQDVVPFSAVGSGTSAPKTRNYDLYQPAELTGVNSQGQGIGFSYYDPLSGWFEPQPPFALNGGRGAADFTVLQRGCAALVAFCMSYVSQEQSFSFTCAFGGCSINDQGVTLGEDGYTQAEMIYPLGNPSGETDLPFGPGTGGFAAVGINDSGQIAYTQEQSSSNYSPYIYTVGAAAPVALGGVPGQSCSSYWPLSESNTGEVLGIAFGCGSSYVLYWTWDSTNGMQNLDSQVTLGSAYASFIPLGVNDNGQILVQLNVASSGPSHWGILNPSGSGIRRHRGRRAAPHAQT